MAWRRILKDGRLGKQKVVYSKALGLRLEN